MNDSKHVLDMTQGSILKNVLLFVYPLICTFATQILFSAVDMAVVGRFSSPRAMAAIGATLHPINLILRILMGVATGVNAVAATYFGAKERLNFHRSVHTAILMSVIGGTLFMVLAIFAGKPLLQLINVPEDIMQDACWYMWIYFLGIPALVIFSFGSSILRSAGDSKRPMYYLFIVGVVNISLNLLFVIGFRMAVVGVAIATTIANFVAAALILRALYYSTDICHLKWQMLKIDLRIMRKILWVGVPAGFNSTFFCVANMVIQAALNSFGSLAIAGAAAANSIENLLTVTSGAFQQTAMTIVAQNYGAKNFTRAARSCVTVIGTGCLVAALVSWSGCFAAGWLLRIYTGDAEVIGWGVTHIKVEMSFYFLGALMECACGCLRGLGCSMIPALATFCGAFVFRIIWVWLIFPHIGTFASLVMCFPISWGMVSIFNTIMLYVILKKIFRREAGLKKISIFP